MSVVIGEYHQGHGAGDDFTAWLEAHRDEITALQIFLLQPTYRRRELTFSMIKEALRN